MKLPEIEARKLLRIFSIVRLPTPLQDICENLKIDVVFLSSEAITDAMYTIGLQGPVIVINDLRPVNRKRFTLAHEIGHFRLGHGPISFKSNIQSLRYSAQETQANRFAAELLMPKDVLKKRGFMTPKQISELCQVSIDAATIRARQLGWFQ
jgi:Zn-dependent peptidase ImmA (M78 family)